MSKIKFERARPLIESVYNRQVTDWPDSMNSDALGILQEPPKQVIRRGNDEPSAFALYRAYSETNKIQRAIQNAIDSGELANEPTPNQFKKWLLAQGETPSEHIKAWFDARCTPKIEALPVVKYPAKQRNVVRKRLHYLDPKFRLAEDLSESSDPNDVWTILLDWSKNKEHGFFGVTDAGIQYSDAKDKPQEFSKRQLVRYMNGVNLK
ncbi:MAG: hypothetical protein WCJ49_02580 [Deltaproteobacteria bacterium]